jgi:SulP family sulfate permease
LLAVICIHLATLGSRRPMLYCPRFFEATMMAAMMDQAIVRFSSWGLVDSIGVRLAFLCLIGAGAGLAVGLLYFLRAGRITRFIPAPVFAGFYNSIALSLVISQTLSLMTQASGGPPLFVIGSVAGVSMVAGVAVLRWRPNWPVAAIGLAAGLLLGLVWEISGQRAPVVISGGWTLVLPFSIADFAAFTRPGVQVWSVAGAIALNAVTLATMLFITTTMASQSLTQADGKRAGARGSVAVIAGMALGGLMGAAPVAGSMQASAAATRTSPLTSSVVGWSALVIVAVYWSGILGWIPLAAVSGALLREALFMVDRSSLRLFVRWVRRKPLAANSREDIALVTVVTTTAVVFNLVVAVLVGLLLGLALFAVRNARRPVRHVWTGAQITSNCARSRGDQQVLAMHPDAIKVFELEGDLFFGAAESLERSLETGSAGAVCVILDWSRVRHVDSSLVLSVANIVSEMDEQGLLIIHAGTGLRDGEVGEELRECLPNARFARNLDYALEDAENEVIDRYRIEAPAESTSMLDSMALFQGMDTRQRDRLQQAMTEKFFTRGAVVCSAGEAADELMLVLHGSASILVFSPEGEVARLAGVRRGATIGEIGFLDRAPRSASVVAQEDVIVAVLTREAYDQLCESEPQLVQQLLANIALDVASRLRHTNRLALARVGGA